MRPLSSDAGDGRLADLNGLARRRSAPVFRWPGRKSIRNELTNGELKRGELGVTQLPPSPTLPSQNPALPRRGFSFFVELKGMPDYWVFQDKLFKRACIHRSNCSVRKSAISPGRLEGTWHGAYTTYEEARRTAAELSPKKGAQLNCRLCHPQNF